MACSAWHFLAYDLGRKKIIRELDVVPGIRTDAQSRSLPSGPGSPAQATAHTMRSGDGRALGAQTRGAWVKMYWCAGERWLQVFWVPSTFALFILGQAGGAGARVGGPAATAGTRSRRASRESSVRLSHMT